MVLPICAGTSLKANLAKKQFKMTIHTPPMGHVRWVSTCTVRVYYTYNAYARRWKAHMTTELRQERWG